MLHFIIQLCSPIADYIVALYPNLTVYLQDQRGTGKSSPLNCQKNPPNFNPYSDLVKQQTLDCVNEIKAAYSVDELQYYDTYNGALDIRDTINLLNPSTISIYALSYGTFFTNTYLQLPNARADAVILDGPVPPNRWVLENNNWWSEVAQDLITLCTELSSTCNEKLAENGHLPRLVMDAILDGTLPCLQQLPWLNSDEGHFLARSYSSYMVGYQDAHPLMAPFWYRMYRCSPSDVQQLNHFHKYRAPSFWSSPSNSVFSFGLAHNIGCSEVYSFAGDKALTYDQQVQQVSRMFSEGGGNTDVSFVRDVGQFPLYTPRPETYLKFAQPKVPVIILSGESMLASHWNRPLIRIFE